MGFRFGGKQKNLSFGPYPLIPLKKARELRDEAKRQIMESIDPSVLKQQKKRGLDAGEGSFSTVAREWHVKFLPPWTEDHCEKMAHPVFGVMESQDRHGDSSCPDESCEALV